MLLELAWNDTGFLEVGWHLCSRVLVLELSSQAVLVFPLRTFEIALASIIADMLAFELLSRSSCIPRRHKNLASLKKGARPTL
jgi:hypothetical protein